MIVSSSDPLIVGFDITSLGTQQINFAGSAQALSMDQDNKVVYWDNFGTSEKHNLMRTYWETEQTQALNISYDGEISLAQDHMHLYVLDKDNYQIDKYNKRTLDKVDVFNTNEGPREIIIAFGKYALQFD